MIDGTAFAYPETLVGIDLDTTMINGIGVVGWGVGGIEAEAVMLGQPYYMFHTRGHRGQADRPVVSRYYRRRCCA